MLACLTGSLAACAAPAAPPSASPPAAPARIVPSDEGPATSQPHTGGIHFIAWGGESQIQAYQSLVALYEQQHPGKVVNLVTMPDAGDYQKRLATDFAGGSAADVLVLSYLNMPSYASRRLLAPVGPYLAASHVLKLGDFYSEAVDPFTYDRQLQCLPQDASGLVIYYNQNLFQKAGLSLPHAGWTWDDVLADARGMTHHSNGGGQPDQYGLGFEPSLPLLAPFVWQNQGSLVEDPLAPSRLALNMPAVITATTWLVSLQTQYHVVPDSQAELASSSEQRFMDGTMAMFISTRAGVPTYRQVTGLDWDVAPLPSTNGRGINVLFADGYCLSAASAQKADAWQFIEFAASPAGEAILARSGAIVPALTSVARSPDFLDPAFRPASGQVFLDAVARAEPLPLEENWYDIQAIADEELQQAFYGHKSVVDALAAATTRTEEYFKIHTAH